ncbi:hypothetical protein [Streptomyces atroolivaceus]|uniref:hypothetical protein n=1 Tax=Streptomyces atroolivaceus TaxID=66869 RepID=UPI00341691DE
MPVDLPSRVTVRPATLVDVPAVVRLFAPQAASFRASGKDDGSADVDWELAQRAMRLMLAHYALEDGHVRTAEREDGTLLAAAIWLPPEAGAEAADERFGGLLEHELDVSLSEPSGLATVLKAACPDEPHWKVVTVCAPEDIELWDHALAAELLAPGLRAADEERAPAVAITLSVDLMAPLWPLGFGRPYEVQSAPGASVWLTARGPAAPCPVA